MFSRFLNPFSPLGSWTMATVNPSIPSNLKIFDKLFIWVKLTPKVWKRMVDWTRVSIKRLPFFKLALKFQKNHVFELWQNIWKVNNRKPQASCWRMSANLFVADGWGWQQRLAVLQVRCNWIKPQSRRAYTKKKFYKKMFCFYCNKNDSKKNYKSFEMLRKIFLAISEVMWFGTQNIGNKKFIHHRRPKTSANLSDHVSPSDSR